MDQSTSEFTNMMKNLFNDSSITDSKDIMPTYMVTEVWDSNEGIHYIGVEDHSSQVLLLIMFCQGRLGI